MEKMDKLFSEKFANYEKAAPSGAWTKIGHNLDRRDHKFVWLKIAAGVSVLAIATILIVRTSTDRSENLSHRNSKTSPAKEHTPDVTPVVEQPTLAEQPIATNESKEQTTTHVKSKEAPLATTETVNAVAMVEDTDPVNKKIETNTDIAGVENARDEDASPITENAVVLAEEAPNEGSVPETENAVTIVYSAEEVNSKYLNKDQDTEATSEDKNSSTLRKLLEKAYDLKHNQDPFGGLRQKKNEILALNFKKEKERSQNR